MSFALWTLASALAVSLTLTFPRGADWQHPIKLNYPNGIKDVEYEFQHNQPAEASDIIFEQVRSNLKRTGALTKKAGKTIAPKAKVKLSRYTYYRSRYFSYTTLVIVVILTYFTSNNFSLFY